MSIDTRTRLVLSRRGAILYKTAGVREIAKYLRGYARHSALNAGQAAGVPFSDAIALGGTAKTAGAQITPERVHEIAKSRGVPNDSSKRGLMSISKRLTGKAHLDDMTPTELRKVALSLVVSYEMDRKERAAAIASIKLGSVLC